MQNGNAFCFWIINDLPDLPECSSASSANSICTSHESPPPPPPHSPTTPAPAASGPIPQTQKPLRFQGASTASVLLSRNELICRLWPNAAGAEELGWSSCCMRPAEPDREQTESNSTETERVKPTPRTDLHQCSAKWFCRFHTLLFLIFTPCSTFSKQRVMLLSSVCW